MPVFATGAEQRLGSSDAKTIQIRRISSKIDGSGALRYEQQATDLLLVSRREGIFKADSLKQISLAFGQSVYLKGSDVRPMSFFV